MPGTLKKQLYAFACYGRSWFSGEWFLLDCPFTIRVQGLKPPVDAGDNNGGHQHDFASHPLIEPPNGKLEYTGDRDPSPLRVEGQTAGSTAEVSWVLPGVAGKIVGESLVDSPHDVSGEDSPVDAAAPKPPPRHQRRHQPACLVG